ncbi:hypothetical protein WICPIJ_002246 [Wickerhamomyces pijperi]|uniref:Uncharacterized protein n=1 Tax=Wickerhamomyces pijperi TaxID=599730 RepID=A0A9P8QA30_WICPI|nr:hypothetical protein WICPIJ_002246 [Wickerhamomyces pijperi]
MSNPSITASSNGLWDPSTLPSPKVFHNTPANLSPSSSSVKPYVCLVPGTYSPPNEIKTFLPNFWQVLMSCTKEGHL